MDLWTATRVVARHWVVLLVGLALTGAMLVAVYLSLQPQYSSTGTVIVIAPSATSNPLTTLNSSNQLAASVVVTLASTGASGAEVRARGGAAEYALVADPNLPIITITATSSNPDVAAHTVAVVPDVMNDLLVQHQLDLAVPRSTWLQVVSLENPTAAVSTGGRAKVLVIAAALGVLVAISLTFIAESIAVFRRRRHGLPARDAVSTALPTETGDSDVGPVHRARSAAATPTRTRTAVPTPTPASGDKAEMAGEVPSPAGELDPAHDDVSRTIQAMADAAGHSYAVELRLVRDNPSLISAWLEEQENADSIKTLQPARWARAISVTERRRSSK